jgi:serine/threonine-protein kinase
MNQREQFGGYVLFRKLAEDPLGETFRAGRLGKQSVEKVALLRVFNGQGIDTTRLWARLRPRAGVQQLLKTPNLGDGIDVGEVRGVPYVGYDYVSGKTIASLLEQAEKRRRPVPLDHALLIVERMAQGLAVAYETRHADDRVLHGFVVPHLVLLSSEGETRVLGIEVGPGLREAASGPAVHQAFARYLSPEALAGEPVSKTDDVYSLGVLLYELITNRRLPPPAAMGYGPVVDEAMVAGEGTPLSPEIAALLKKALAHREQRWPEVATFHKALAKLMSDGAYNPTTFNLAFFMHSLFREDIERETQEIEAEKKLPMPVAAAPTAEAARPAAPVAPVPPTPPPRFNREATMPGVAPGGGSNKGLLYGGIAAAVAVLGIGGYLMFGRSSPPPPAAAVAPAAAVVPEPAPAPAGPTPEQIQAQMAALVEERLKSSEAALRKQYDEQLKTLQRQLEESSRRPAPTAPAPSTAASTVATQPAAPTAPAPAPTTGATPATASATPPGPASTAPAAPVQPTPTPAPVVPEPAPIPVTPAPAAPAPVRLGDLVSMGAGVSPPKVMTSAQPRYPAIARQTGRTATVQVRVLVDENGRPQDVQLAGARVGLGFDEAALDAARRTTFQAATKNGVRVKMWTNLNIRFTP